MKIAILTTDNREPFRDFSSPQPYFGTAPEALLQGLALLPDVEIHVVSCVRQPVGSPDKLASNIFYHSVQVSKFGWMRTGYLGCVRAVREKLREIAPDLVHGQGTERDCAPCAVFSGFPNVLTIHGNMAELARLFHAKPLSFHWLAARLENFVLRQTGGVFCNSGYTESLVQPRAKRVWRVENPVRELFFKSPAAVEKFARPTIVNIGLICPRKRQVELLAMAKELHGEGHEFEFLFAGALPGGEAYSEEFRRRMQHAETGGYARYLGTQDIGALIALFDRSHAMLHFPLEESFGLVVAEALARNLKFFGADVGGIPDIAKGVELAELHPPQDWPSLKRGLIRWLEEACPVPARAAAEMAARYHPRIIAQKHLEIYRAMLGRSRGSECGAPARAT